MKYLLDTHTLLWYASGDQNLPARLVPEIDAAPELCAVSIATLWEMAIKVSLGKLDLNMSLEQFVQQAVYANRFALLAISVSHVHRLGTMVHHHRDPFDRMLVAQALVEDLTIISADPALDAYGVRRLW